MSLVWEITKNNSSFLKRTKLYDGAAFNTAPTNPLNINSEKYTKTQAVSVDVTPKGNLVIKKSTLDCSVRKPKEFVKKTKVTKGQKSVTNFARNIVEATESEDFRGDLKAVLVARAAKLLKNRKARK
ncbi:predicted protein [Naegleria gruberi]|uniref:Predicted protein n=1 Tax=Naegleria gruberi TaxID=5762 RepID=D2VT20_NAEGR|nr:uncharacterized protein NAEGRDRAFT_81126 [Naegleria gruberi]EFC40007.1 predicted protein [Naegleria gruberi]|eukprot:XP_002672751.1 predicted protein [Naegleria gruberi strain NEG-M]